LLENKHGRFAIIHETDAAIHAMAEIVKQIVQTARKASLDVANGDIRPGNDPTSRHDEASRSSVERYMVMQSSNTSRLPKPVKNVRIPSGILWQE
jgi:hypothetical protein